MTDRALAHELSFPIRHVIGVAQETALLPACGIKLIQHCHRPRVDKVAQTASKHILPIVTEGQAQTGPCCIARKSRTIRQLSVSMIIMKPCPSPTANCRLGVVRQSKYGAAIKRKVIKLDAASGINHPRHTIHCAISEPTVIRPNQHTIDAEPLVYQHSITARCDIPNANCSVGGGGIE